MKQIYLLAIGLLCCCSCKKKNTQPEEYFSFDADGVHYEYLQEKGTSLFAGNWSTLSAGPTSATVGYQIYAYSRKNLAAEGAFIFSFSSNEMPDRDTIILDGVYNKITIRDFNVQDNSYVLAPPLSGKIVFTQRTNQKLSGTFVFDASQSGGTIIHIANGKFSIIP